MKNNKIFPLKVYTFVDKDRHHNGYDIVNSEKELAQKLLANCKEKLVTDSWDLPVLDYNLFLIQEVYDNRLHYGSDAPNYKPWFSKHLLPILIDMLTKDDFNPCINCLDFDYCKAESDKDNFDSNSNEDFDLLQEIFSQE